MAWFKSKPDPISDRARALNDEIAHLEAEIRRLDTELQSEQAQPRLRSTALPHGETLTYNGQEVTEPASAPVLDEPIFEEVDRAPLAPPVGEPVGTPAHYNELGVRKYDLPALLRRFRNLFHGPSTTNPKLVSYLAAGGIQGLRPLRYEKRVARNRFIALALLFLFALLCIVGMFYHRR
jgi:hypothetical protein